MSLNLVIDVGNSFTKLFVIKNFNILYSSVYHSLSDIENIFTLFPGLENGIYSASGEIPEELKEFITKRLENVVAFNSTTPVPIGNLYHTPETLGADRLAAAIGVNHFFPRTNTIIFDFGTAITIDFIDNENNFAGGNISPGLAIRFNALNQYTKKLPLLSIPKNVEKIGKTTRQAIEAGVVNGIIGEVLNYIQTYNTHKVVFTGGDSFFFVNKIKIPIFVFRNPIVYGLNIVLNHQTFDSA